MSIMDINIDAPALKKGSNRMPCLSLYIRHNRLFQIRKNQKRLMMKYCKDLPGALNVPIEYLKTLEEDAPSKLVFESINKMMYMIIKRE